MSKRLRFLRSVALGCAFALPAAAVAVLPLHAQNPTAPDNSARNKEHSTTADQQSHDAADRDATKKIRQSLMADKSLSTYGHNVKVICQGGNVTLRGPVHSDDEKRAIEAHAGDVVGHDKVTSQLEVKQ